MPGPQAESRGSILPALPEKSWADALRAFYPPTTSRRPLFIQGLRPYGLRPAPRASGFRSQLFTAALLVLLPAAARTRFVGTDLGARAHERRWLAAGALAGRGEGLFQRADIA